MEKIIATVIVNNVYSSNPEKYNNDLVSAGVGLILHSGLWLKAKWLSQNMPTLVIRVDDPVFKQIKLDTLLLNKYVPKIKVLYVGNNTLITLPANITNVQSMLNLFNLEYKLKNEHKKSKHSAKNNKSSDKSSMVK